MVSCGAAGVCPHLSAPSRALNQTLTLICQSPHHTALPPDGEGTLWSLFSIHELQRSEPGPAGAKRARCSAAGPVVRQAGRYQRETGVFHLFQDWDVFRGDKRGNICCWLCGGPQPPVSQIKLSTACSGSLCCVHVITAPQNPFRPPRTLRTVCLPPQQKREINKKSTAVSSELEKVWSRSSCRLSGPDGSKQEAECLKVLKVLKVLL